MAEAQEPWITQTQQDLGAFIKAPKLTDKLLRKPPFRFLHDCVTAFLKATGFPNNYFTEDELDSGKVTEKDAKINFLAKLIAVVEAASGKPVVAKPHVVVTGAEPEATADLLIKLAACGKLSKADMETAVKKALGGGSASASASTTAPPKEKPKEKAPAPAQPPAAAAEEEKPKERPRPKEEKPKEEPKAAEEEKGKVPPPKDDASKGPSKDKAKEDRAKESKPEEAKKEKEAPPAARPAEAPGKKEATVPAVTPLAPADNAGARPGTATARKPPPALKSNEVVEDRSDIKAGPNAAVILEAKEKDEKKADERDWQTVVEEEEEAAARAREAKTGDKGAKGYLGKAAQDAMKQQEEKEAREKAEAEAAGRKAEGIVLQSRRRNDKAGGGMGETEMTKLREQLQLLTKATNPLGKFLEAIHEDVDTMSRELEMWRTEARTQLQAAQEAQRQTEEALREVHAKLQAVEDQISDQIVKINITRQSILANDQTTETLLRMVVNPEVGGKKPTAGKA